MRQKIRRFTIILSFILFPVTVNYFSPFLSTWGASRGVVNGSLILFAALFLSALVTGRAFCGWACPGAGLQEALAPANESRITRGNRVKWLIWTPWITTIAVLLLRAGAPPVIEPLFMMESVISVSRPVMFIVYFAVVALIALPALVVGRRSFCHHICWMAPFMIMGRRCRDLLRLPALRLAPAPGACTKCGRCTARCPMSLPVQDMVIAGSMRNDECILCGECVDTCPNDALAYGFGRRP